MRRSEDRLNVVIVNYGRGNLHSVNKAVTVAARALDGEVDVNVTADPAEIIAAHRIILPGVGAFAACMRGIAEVPGLRDTLDEAVLERKTPILGICVGMQLMGTSGTEFGITAGLGWIAGEVRALPRTPHLPLPHMSWQPVVAPRPHPVIRDMWAYFVHSYAFVAQHEDNMLAISEYGVPFAAAVGRDNIVGTQFHPEKSQRDGIALLTRFLRWNS